MAVDSFLKIDCIPGESTDDRHKDWIEIASYRQGFSQPVSSTVNSVGGASTEQVNFGAFAISKLVDKDGTICQTAPVYKSTWHVGKMRKRPVLLLRGVSRRSVRRSLRYRLHPCRLAAH